MNPIRTCSQPGMLLSLLACLLCSCQPMFCGPLQASDALSKLTEKKMQAIQDSVTALRATRQDVSPSGTYRQIRANLHVHSHWSHDSRGQIEEIVAAARTVGTDVLMFTEHPAEHYDFFQDGHQGTRDGVLLIPGAEMQGFLVYPTMSLKGITAGSPQELADLVRGRDGQLFVSHLEERMDWEIAGVSGVEIYNTHADFKEEKELISALKNPLRVYQLAGLIRKYPQECYSALQDYPSDYLRKWDRLCQTAPHTGVSANDAHQNIGIVIRWIEGDNARIEDALGERIFDLNLNLVPGSQEMKKDKQPGDVLFRMQLDPYENSLRHVATHLLVPRSAAVGDAEPLTVEMVREALEAGRAYVGFDWIADSSGFEFYGEQQDAEETRRLELGDQVPWKSGTTLKARSPLPVHWKLMCDGELVSESDGREFSSTADREGVYRIEAWVSIDGEPTIWVLSNPIYLNLASGLAQEAVIDDEPVWTSEQTAFFESKVRPIFVEYCLKCHAADKSKGGLQLISRGHLLSGGDSGPAIVPGDVSASLLLQAVRYDGLQMPPDQKLSERQVEILADWVRMGAPWPGGSEDARLPVRSGAAISDEDRNYWAFQPVVRPEIPALRSLKQPDHPIDAFIHEKLEQKNLQPNPPASPRELIRRATFDLTGLPPTPEEVAEFERRWIEESANEESASEEFASEEFVGERAGNVPRVYAELIEQLLARPEYGERWGRHWLDVVRFAQSNGYERDGEKEFVWKYRDYVIRSFNEDKPYDRFVLEQLAGDELPDATADSRIATGFYRLGVWDDEADDPRQAEFDDLDDIMVSTGASFLGMTLGCCRCHDHKFDPLPQEDYYKLLAYFRNIQRYSVPRPAVNSTTFLPTIDRARLASVVSEHEARRNEARQKLEAASGTEREALERIVRDENLPLTPDDWTNGVRESGSNAPAVHVLIRGNAGQEGSIVQPGLPQIFGAAEPAAIPLDGPIASSGRRLALGRWIASKENPLTARVMVNRIWHHHFGKGIVRTTTDFGKAGLPPSHPELLDWLADEFVQHGWSVKQMHRLMMSSETYRRSSATNTPHGAESSAADPGNEWYWRADLRRLSAEAVRDSILAISGQLNPERGGRGFFPRLAGEVIAGGSRPGSGWEVSSPEQQNRRSVYMFVKRTMSSPWLDLFDYTNLTQPIAERPVTTVAPQALMLLNDDFMQRQSSALAVRVQREAGSDLRTQLQRAFELAVQRLPTDEELKTLESYVLRQRESAKALRNRATFRPDVPLALHAGYLAQLKPQDCLRGPEAGWSYVKGRWTGGYEGILNQNLDFGPAALWDRVRFMDGTVRTTLELVHSSEFASVIVRSVPDGDFVNGLEIRLIPADDVVEIAQLRGERRLLAKTTVPLETGEPIRLTIQLNGPAVKVQVGKDEPAGEASTVEMEATQPEPIQEAGRVGIRGWGAPVHVESLMVEPLMNETDSEKFEMTQPDDSEREALAWACLLMLNLNEVVYVD